MKQERVRSPDSRRKTGVHAYRGYHTMSPWGLSPAPAPICSSFRSTWWAQWSHLDVLGVEPEFGGLGHVVGVGDAGELLDLARPRELVEPLAVAALAFLQRRRHVDLDEGAVLLDHLAHRRRVVA
jgi:hypothetical protein